jgi:hypothetical protein
MNSKTNYPISGLPLQVTGIPARAAEWLRVAGVPVEEISSGAVSEGRDDLPGTCGPLLFDSRTPSSRFDAEQAARRGLKILDVVDLLRTEKNEATNDSHIVLFDESPPVPPENPRRRLFLERLKQQIDNQDGVWARVADFPYPYQAAICVETDIAASAISVGNLAEFVTPLKNNLFSTENSSGNLNDSLGIVHRFYSSGRLMSLGNDLKKNLADEIVAGIDAGHFPLMWQTVSSELANWFTERRRISVRIQKNEARYFIECEMPKSGFQPALELWRGGHCASIPLNSGRIEIEQASIVFQQGAPRHPAGLTANESQSFFLNELMPARAG